MYFQLHDAYIELGDLIIKSERSPLQAVTVYARYPFQETSSFDDAYLHGEIVRLLMKHEQFNDPRLQKHMIGWGRVMGIGELVLASTFYEFNHFEVFEKYFEH